MSNPAHRPLHRLAIVAATVTTTLIALVASTAASPASSTAPALVATDSTTEATAQTERPKMLVIGDSYTSYYGDRASRFPGWWATLAADLGADPVIDAVGGTGFLSRSSYCIHSRFRGRMETIRRTDPQILFVEGGRNDWRRCNEEGVPVESTRREITTAVNEYFAELAEVWDELGRPRSDVYVLTPWGASKPEKARVIRPIVKDAAETYGFNWVPTRRLTRDLAPDGIHPNNLGSRFLRDEILANSNLLDRFSRI